MPTKNRVPYMDDLMQKMIERCPRPNGDGDGDAVVVPYSDVMIYAKRKGVSKLKGSQGLIKWHRSKTRRQHIQTLIIVLILVYVNKCIQTRIT